MTTIRSLVAIGALFVLSAGTLSAQAMKVTCKDGSRSAGGQGACSSHGGIAVAKTATKSAKADAKAMKSTVKADVNAAKSEAKADGKAMKSAATSDAKTVKAAAKTELEDKDPKGAIAMCKDKTYSHAKSRQGVCSAHGGVAKFMDSK
ncbi:MAG TPA: DUF3761 domain-containing protein [Gemmatimonadaceae bacterium]|jgi:Protein of unknown function (DUF3761)|nr:DUF3761 domain-containing protein [Gemmatimonadaceae bacterium]